MAPEYCFPGFEWHLKDIVNFNIDDQFHLIVMLNSDRILQAMKMDCKLKDYFKFLDADHQFFESKTYGIDGMYWI